MGSLFSKPKAESGNPSRRKSIIGTEVTDTKEVMDTKKKGKKEKPGKAKQPENGNGSAAPQNGTKPEPKKTMKGGKHPK